MRLLIAQRGMPLATVAAWLLANPAALGASLTATVDRNVVPVGESLRLSLTFDGAAPPGTPGLPNIPHLSPRGVSQSSSFSIINGQASHKITYDYTLLATQPGDVTIPAIQVQVGGQILASQPVRVRVMPQSAAVAAAVTNIAFLRLVVPKTEVYVGEGIPVEMHLYYRNVEGVQMPQLKAEGFSIGQSAEPSQSQTQVGGIPYSLVTFRTSVTPARSGELSLGPAEIDLTLLIPVQRRETFFDPFGMFNTHQRRRTKLQSEPVVMRVLPLPTDNVPPNFTGAVGTFNMAVSASPTNVAVGDPITVKVNISGQGRLDTFSLPEQSQWRDFNKYDPTKKVEAADVLGLAGSVAFEQVITPQNHELRVIPPLEFSFFDLAQKQYRTLTGPAIPLAVRNTAVAAAPPMLATNATAPAAPPADDILHIRAQFAAGAGGKQLLNQPWFLGLQAVPVLAWLALFVARKRRESLANNPRRRRQREVAAKIREGLKELRTLAAAQNSDAFFATLFRLLQEQIGERLDMPASAITEAVVDERLRSGALPPSAAAELHDLFQMCNQARYAPQKTSQELSAIIPRAENVLRELQRI